MRIPRCVSLICLFSLPLLLVRPVLAASGCQAPASSDPYATVIQDLIEGVRSGTQSKIDEALAVLLVPTSRGSRFLAKAGPSIEQILDAAAADPNSAFNKAVQAWQSSRIDVQTGATPTSSGSTDLVARAGLATLFSAAYEVGAFTQSTSGNTTTFNVNAGGFLDAIAHRPVVCPSMEVSPDKVKDSWLSLNHVNAAVSVNLNQNGATTVPVRGTANSSTTVPTTVDLPAANARIGDVTVRYAVRAAFDPRSKGFQQAWVTAHTGLQAAITASAAGLGPNLAKAVQALKPSEYVVQRAKYKPIFLADAARHDTAQLTKDFSAYFAELLIIASANDATLQTDLATARLALSSFAGVNQQMLDTARTAIGYSLTLEGDFNRPDQQPETYTGRIIFSDPMGKALLSANGAFTVYGSMPAGAKYNQFRDVQVSGQFDTPLGNPNNSLATLSAAAYLQYQTDPSVLDITAGNLAPGTNITLPSNAQVLLGPKGLIAIGQFKLTINAKNGIRIPLSVEYSNKTDLLNATDVRGNFGISYDFSSFGSIFGAK